MGYALLTSYQFIATFVEKAQSTFFGYSAIFLSLNCMVVVLIIFLNRGIRGATMSDLLSTKLKLGEPRDHSRQVEFEEEIHKEKHDFNYFPTYNDVTDLFTAATFKDQRAVGAFGGGIQNAFSKLAPL